MGAKSAYEKLHLDKESVATRNGGAHFQYLENYLARNGKWLAGGPEISIADLQLFDIVDLHMILLPDYDFKLHFPRLSAHWETVRNIPAIAAYLESPKRLSKVNGN